MGFSTLLFEINKKVATLTLNRPNQGNAMNAEMFKDLLAAALLCAKDAQIKAVVITGAGRLFCAGGDLNSFRAQKKDLPHHIRTEITFLHAFISHLARMPKPVIAAVNGPAAGAGFSLVCASDLAIAAESAKFTMAYTRAGLTPDGSSTFFLPRIVGAKRAMELTLLNRALSAAEACQWGIINRVVSDDKVLETALALAEALAHGPAEAFGRSKRLLLESSHETLESQMEHEAEAICAITGTANAHEGIAAFLEKRAPNFE